VSYFVRIRGSMHGPFDGEKLKRLAAAGKISRADEVSRDREKWVKAGGVKGLFPSTELATAPASRASPSRAVAAPIAPAVPAAYSSPAIAPASEVLPAVEGQGIFGRVTMFTARLVGSSSAGATPLTPTPIAPAPTQVGTKPCPFCAEPILVAAKKCKHCGEIVDVTMRPAGAAPAPQVIHAPQPAINITNVNHNVVGGGRYKRWSRIVAFLLSFFIPGLGQLYQGRLIAAAIWFFVVLVGYIPFVIPGMILHLLCAVSAGLADPYR